jgi:AbrB family looped-hinge helix DNA binding protein
MKITEKRQITIPADLGKKHGLSPGADVEFVDQPNGLLIIKAAHSRKRGQEVLETLLRGGPIKGRTEDWLRLTRGDR